MSDILPPEVTPLNYRQWLVGDHIEGNLMAVGYDETSSGEDIFLIETIIKVIDSDSDTNVFIATNVSPNITYSLVIILFV